MSSAAIPVHVALVDRSQSIDHAELAGVSAALNEQIQADFAPVWHVRATVAPYLPDAVPFGCWSVVLDHAIDDASALGYHSDEANQPYAVVGLDASGSEWPSVVGHEVLEMLADPWGNRLHGARLPVGMEIDHRRFGLAHDSSHVRYLLEVCDPPEAISYEVAGVKLSDFLHPAWYRTSRGPHPYDHLRVLSSPREVAPGGYVSFCNPDGYWFQVFVNSNGHSYVSELGKFDRTKHASLRAFTDEHSRRTREG